MPIRMMVSGVRVFFTVRVEKSILARASSSLRTISILSVPMPVETTVRRFWPMRPVWEMNSR